MYNPYIIQNTNKVKIDKDLLPKEINPHVFPNLFLNSNPTKIFHKVRRYDISNSDETCFVRKVFFSNQNMDIIQKQLIINVFKKSNKKYKIPFQNNNDIQIVMRYIYNFYGNNLDFKIKQQIIDLNKKVVDELTPSIIINLDSYYKYLKDSTTQPQLIDLPLNLSSQGNRTLASNTTIY